DRRAPDRRARSFSMRDHSLKTLESRFGVGLLLCVVTGTAALAQEAAGGPLTLNDAVALALKNYPEIRASRARTQAAQEGVAVARTAYLPRLDLYWQETLATTNNVFG